MHLFHRAGLLLSFLKLLMILLVPHCGIGQHIYFHQDFTGTRSFINPQPDTGQFSHVILTAPVLSYHKFHKGFMELVRTRQDSATGGIIRALRATPFSPSPEVLFVQVTLSAESIGSESVNAVYFYTGENFNPVNNSFPGNELMFGKFALNFSGSGFSVKDLATQATSETFNTKSKIVLTWVLNNGKKPAEYFLPANNTFETVLPGCYDLWTGGKKLSGSSRGYPGNSAYSPAKLSNFEIRYRNGIGKIRIYEILIKSIDMTDPAESLVMPNPADRQQINLKARDPDLASIRLSRLNGQQVALKTKNQHGQLTALIPIHPLAPGIYMVDFLDGQGRKRTVRVMVE